ncbi:MAG TPA: DUF4190 domain-containing protein [Micromonosporaceae bacterium]|nr:DUF4190 domain-containing protein [Micromonosporaceae bacterium]
MTEEGQSAPYPSGPTAVPSEGPPPLPQTGVMPASAVGPVAGHVVPGPLIPLPPPREAWRAPRRVEPVAGTPFGVVHLDVPPVTSGLAIGSLLAGIGSVVVAFSVACFGLAGMQGGWGGWAAGAFAVLGLLLGTAAIVLGLLSQRQIRRVSPPPAIRFTGRGLAIAGISCGAAGLSLTLLAFLAALLLQAGSTA